MKILNHFIGTVGSDVRVGVSAEDKRWASFRMAVSHDAFNPQTGAFEEYETSWFDVSAFGALASDLGASVRKGDPVVVVGRLRLREWSTEDKSGVTPQIIAEAVGHNLRFGVSSFQRTARKKPDPGHEGVDGANHAPDPASRAQADAERELVAAAASAGEDPPF